MREFPYLMVGKILEELASEGINLTRVTFYRLEKRMKFPTVHRTVGGWRTYTRKEADQIKKMIKQNYNIQ